MSKKKDPSEKFQSLSTKLPPETVKNVRRIARDLRVPPAQIVRDALADYVKAHPPGPGKKRSLSIVEESISRTALTEALKDDGVITSLLEELQRRGRHHRKPTSGIEPLTYGLRTIRSANVILLSSAA